MNIKMKNKTSKIFWSIWIVIGILLSVINLLIYFNASTQPDKAIGWVVLFGAGIYIFFIYIGITILLWGIWGIIKLIRYIIKQKEK